MSVLTMAPTECSLVVLVVLATSVLLSAAPSADEESIIELPDPLPEEACSRAGGMCIPESECPAGKLNPKKGLCPKQQSAGIECCHSLPMNEKRCTKRGGECMLKTMCARILWDENAKDCSLNEACCILIEK